MMVVLRIHIVLFILISLLTSESLFAQCSDLTIEEMTARNGLDAILIENHQVKLKEGTMKRPVRTKSVEVFLEANILYRFSLFADEKDGNDAVLQLYEHRELLGSSIDDLTGKDVNRFEYVSEEDKMLRLVFSSKVGGKVCATALFSMVLQDTTTLMDSRIGSLDDTSLETLYIGIENKVEIVASGVEDGFLEVDISDGSISGADGTYYARLSKRGVANIIVRSYQKDSTLHEESVTPFLVRDLPEPKISIAGLTNGNINYATLKNTSEVQLSLIDGLHQGKYELLEFAFAKNAADIKVFKNNGNTINNRQRIFLNQLKKGDEFYIKQAKVRTPKGEVITLSTSRFKVN
ncbi:MAG: GldM family protein [Bacteroidota bacterium]